MTPERTLEKRLSRLEAERNAKRTSSADRFDGEIDEAVVDTIIAEPHHRLAGATGSVSPEVVASLPTKLRISYGSLDSSDGEPDEQE